MRFHSLLKKDKYIASLQLIVGVYSYVFNLKKLVKREKAKK